MAKSLDKLLQQRQQLDQQIKDAQARARSQAHKDNTKRKIIIGALALSHMKQHPQSNFAKTLRELMQQHVTKARDRELLGLETLPEASPENPEKTA